MAGHVLVQVNSDDSTTYCDDHYCTGHSSYPVFHCLDKNCDFQWEVTGGFNWDDKKEKESIMNIAHIEHRLRKAGI